VINNDARIKHGQIKSKLNTVNACHHLVRNVLSSCFLSKHVKPKIHVTIILHVVVYGCETWSLHTARKTCVKFA
jgi:hypothetical protein